MPTKAEMLKACQWLVTGAKANDSLFFHCATYIPLAGYCQHHSTGHPDSGHGGQKPDTSGGREVDGMDESELMSSRPQVPQAVRLKGR